MLAIPESIKLEYQYVSEFNLISFTFLQSISIWFLENKGKFIPFLWVIMAVESTYDYSEGELKRSITQIDEKKSE